MAVPEPRSRPRKQLDAGMFQPEISSFRLHLAAGARPPRPSGTIPRPSSGSLPPACAARPCAPGGSRWTGRTSAGGWCTCGAGTATPTPATSTVPCSNSSNGGPPRKSSRTRWPSSARRRSPASSSRCSPAENCRPWRRPARAAGSRSAATRDHCGVPGGRPGRRMGGWLCCRRRAVPDRGEPALGRVELAGDHVLDASFRRVPGRRMSARRVSSATVRSTTATAAIPPWSLRLR